MNETLNLTVEVAKNLTSNDTVRESMNQMGTFGLDKLLNLSWVAGIGAWLNSALGTTLFTPQVVGVFLPLISIVLLYWKWNAITGFIHSFGQTLLILAGLFLIAKAVGMF